MRQKGKPNIAQVYGLIDPITHTVKYVGRHGRLQSVLLSTGAARVPQHVSGLQLFRLLRYLSS